MHQSPSTSISVILLKDPACSFRIHGMCIVARWVKTAFGKPVVVLGLMLVAFVALQCCLPLATAVNIGADEDYELSKAVLCLNGHRLYTEVWSDQPPLYVSLLTVILKHLSPTVLGPRLLTTAPPLCSDDCLGNINELLEGDNHERKQLWKRVIQGSGLADSGAPMGV
jgi:hypothetical protein